MAPDPARVDRRRANRQRNGGLGTGRVCMYCGSIDWSHLVPEGIDPEAAGNACRTCHLLLDAAQRDAGVEFRPVPATVPERIVAADRALAAALEFVACGLRKRADALERFLAGLDAAGIAWRDLPGTRP
ncbi:MAG TPA: hypothetical protein VEH29_02310 [Acidimicrobiales bacterium]|nr:hypothetical protein [Acidimicrobiales bacterium]